MPQNNIVDLQIGQSGSLVTGDIYIDYATNTISGPGLSVDVLGQSVALDAKALTLQSNADGSYTIVGTTVALGAIPVATVALTLGSRGPASTTASVTVLGITSVQTEVAAQVICYASGTLIRTALGDVAVEDLQVGDLAVTASGEHRPIRWIGHRDIDCNRHPKPQDVRPIRISTHAFGENRPARDLYLSPGHPVLVGADDGEAGHLVPIMCLVNGTTISRVPVDTVTYWHIELDQHDILLAEGLPAESYIDLGSRPWFDGTDGTLYDPDMAAPGMPGRCRPVAIDGPVVEAERRRLDMMFATRLAGACAWPSAEDMAFAF